MKITGIKLYNHTVPGVQYYKGGERAVGPLDIYDEYNSNIRSKHMPMAMNGKNGQLTGAFIVITTDEGIKGVHGPLEYRAQLLVAVEALSSHIKGRDPMENRMMWDILSRFDRHSRSGIMLMAISAVDIALWDLKGKILGEPVYRLLGGGRSRIKAYASMLAFPLELAEAKQAALMAKEKGFTAQKWFFRHGPASGKEGMRKNLELAFMLRETLGDDYELMFDCWMGWSISYALTIFKELEQVNPAWIEEVLKPHMLEGYRNLHANTAMPLSAGEHLYLRNETMPYLQEGILRVLQSDPEWCGGITEAMRIGDLCDIYGTTFIPHGNSVMPALHVAACMPPDITPYSEFLLIYLEQHKEPYFDRRWLDNEGYIALNSNPGLGEDIDMEKLIHTEEIKSFEIQ